MDILNSYYCVYNQGKIVNCCWIPIHIGVHWNNEADKAAKSAGVLVLVHGQIMKNAIFLLFLSTLGHGSDKLPPWKVYQNCKFHRGSNAMAKISHYGEYALSSTLHASIYSTLIAIVLRDYNDALLCHF